MKEIVQDLHRKTRSISQKKKTDVLELLLPTAEPKSSLLKQQE